jgi:hypothetical protein
VLGGLTALEVESERLGVVVMVGWAQERIEADARQFSAVDADGNVVAAFDALALD